MKLPNLEAAVVPAAKITDYLLSQTHPDGKHKAKFFAACGFSLDDWESLERAVRQHAADHQAAKVEPSPFGARYVIENRNAGRPNSVRPHRLVHPKQRRVPPVSQRVPHPVP